MKDRIAVTRQWLSVQLPGREAPAGLAEALAEGGVTLLESARHPRKLKRGVHRANRFSLVIRGAALDDPRLEARWAWLCAHGVPNAFGPQRFGPQGRNLARARAVLARGWRKRDDRQGMLLSAARSYLFNELLARRLDDGSWNALVPGEVAILDGTASQFVVEDVDAALVERAERLDLHPSGVLWAAATPWPTGRRRATSRPCVRAIRRCARGWSVPACAWPAAPCACAWPSPGSAARPRACGSISICPAAASPRRCCAS